MTRAVIYSRYSTDNQREASIEDQIRIGRAFIEREGWTYLDAYADRALSGASPLRPGYQKLLEDARAGSFEVVVAEALDRLSRDQATSSFNGDKGAISNSDWPIFTGAPWASSRSPFNTNPSIELLISKFRWR